MLILALTREKAHRGESEVRDAMCDRTPPIPGHAAYLPRGRGTDQPLATVEKTGILVKPTFVLLHQGCFSPDVGPHISTTASDGGARVFPERREGPITLQSSRKCVGTRNVMRTAFYVQPMGRLWLVTMCVALTIHLGFNGEGVPISPVQCALLAVCNSAE